MKKFTNGFDSWQETHFEMVQQIIRDLENERTGKVQKVSDEFGQGGLYDLSKKLTDKFENEFEGKCWEGESYYDSLEKFFEKEL